MLVWTLLFGSAVLICCGLAGRLGEWLDLMDWPDGRRKRHARPTPLVGGIALMVPLLVVAILQALFQPAAGGIFGMLAVAGVGFTLLGLFDDRHQATPGLRLLISVMLCGMVLVAAPELRLQALDLGHLHIPLSFYALPFTVLCLVGLQNAINMADGLNGLVIGMSIFWTICLLIYAPAALTLYLLLLLLGLLIVLAFNIRGRLFLGDAGSYSLGISIGLLMLYVYNEANGRLPMLTVMLWLLVPVLDCLRVMIARLCDSRSPVAADMNHLHHRLARCWPWPVSVLVYLALATLPGLISALWLDQTEVMLTATLVGYAGVIWMTRESGRTTLRERNVSAL